MGRLDPIILLLDKGKFSKAESLTRQWLAVSPDDLGANASLVFACQAQEKWNSLICSGEKYLKIYDSIEKGGSSLSSVSRDRWKILLFMGQAWLNSDDLSRAKRLFEQSLSATDNRMACLTAIARIYGSQRKPDEAIFYLQKATDDDPGNIRILHDMARLYERAGDRKSKTEIFKKLIHTGKLDLTDILEIIDCEIERRDWEEAGSISAKITGTYLGEVELFLRRAIISRKQGLIPRAITLLGEAAKYSPEDPRIWGLKGFLLTEHGKNESACALISRYLEDKANYISVHLASAWNLWLKGKREATLTALKGICSLLNIEREETLSSPEDILAVLADLGEALRDRVGSLEGHMALEIAERIAKDEGLDVDKIKRQQAGPATPHKARKRPNPTLSLCMIVKDEEESLDRCLKSVAPLVDEMVIVDTGSTDHTIEIARNYGAHVYHFEWCDDFSKARNFCLRQARCDWILIMDADEVISVKDLPKIKGLLTDARIDGYRFILRNYENNRALANIVLNPRDYNEGNDYFGFIPARLIRLFRRHRAIAFSGAVHETIDYHFNRVGFIAKNRDIPIHHYGKVLPSPRIRKKREYYMKLGEKRVEKHPDDINAVKGLSDQYLELGLWREVLCLLEKSAPLLSGNAELHFNLARAHSALGMPDKAINEYATTLALSPEHMGAYNNLALIYLQNGNHDNALQTLNKGIERGRSHPVFYHNLGNVYSAMGNIDQALLSYRKAIKIDPAFPGTSDRIEEILTKRAQQKDGENSEKTGEEKKEEGEGFRTHHISLHDRQERGRISSTVP